VKKSVGVGLVMAATTVAMAVPPVVAHAAGYSSIGGALVLPMMAGLLPALLAGIRTALIAAAIVSVGSAAAAMTTGDPGWAALVMGTTALITGLACRWGRSKLLVVVPITVGFAVAVTPTATTDSVANGLILGLASLASALWGMAAGWAIGRKTPTIAPHLETWQRTWAYAITLAVLTGVAAGITVSTQWGHAGGWFILTVVLVFQPYLQDSWRRMWQRAAGTIVGVITAFVIHAIVPWTTVELVIGLMLMVSSIPIIVNPKYPYWVFTSVLTPGIILMAGSSGDFEATALARLAATFAGAGLALLAVLLLTPVYSSSAKKHGVERY
jgi:hypothetical protein